MVIMPNEGVSLDDYATDFTSLEYTTLLDSVDVTKTAKAKIPEFSVSGDKSAENITQIVEKSDGAMSYIALNAISSERLRFLYFERSAVNDELIPPNSYGLYHCCGCYCHCGYFCSFY